MPAPLSALPALFFLLAMAATASRCGLPQGFVVATAVYTFGVVLGTELLSRPTLLRLPQVATFWVRGRGALAMAARRTDRCRRRREGAVYAIHQTGLVPRADVAVVLRHSRRHSASTGAEA